MSEILHGGAVDVREFWIDCVSFSCAMSLIVMSMWSAFVAYQLMMGGKIVFEDRDG